MFFGEACEAIPEEPDSDLKIYDGMVNDVDVDHWVKPNCIKPIGCK